MSAATKPKRAELVKALEDVDTAWDAYIMDERDLEDIAAAVGRVRALLQRERTP